MLYSPFESDRNSSLKPRSQPVVRFLDRASRQRFLSSRNRMRILLRWNVEKDSYDGRKNDVRASYEKLGVHAIFMSKLTPRTRKFIVRCSCEHLAILVRLSCDFSPAVRTTQDKYTCSAFIVRCEQDNGRGTLRWLRVYDNTSKQSTTSSASSHCAHLLPKSQTIWLSYLRDCLF